MTVQSPRRQVDSDVRRDSRPKTDRGFFTIFVAVAGCYIVLLVSMLVALASYTTPDRLVGVLSGREIVASVQLSLISATFAMVTSLAVGIPVAYLMSRHHFRAKPFVDAVLDVPNVMPPLVLGLSLLVLFQFQPLKQISPWIVYQIPAVFLAQFVVATAYAIPILRSALDRGESRTEQVALTLGCSRASAFYQITLPEMRSGIVLAGSMGWSRCLGTFGPLLVFAGATRNKTEVLATTIYLELSFGDLEGAVAASIFLVLLAGLVLLGSRWLIGHKRTSVSGASDD